ncbi:hypothetical protein GOBAR_AA00972 [Gossypium barbadense]|uniref:Uncharacterized protein n=1 Tax=Gossypium barbadense TaxID=3634 RepID=A0A2P5YVP3_GOSBA|nr:hypothetical protein GOBAR_AA00972 [Gossypium barbadense]
MTRNRYVKNTNLVCHTQMRQRKTAQKNNSEISSKNLHESCSSNITGPIYEERRLQIDELDEWWKQKSRTPDKPKSSHDELNVAPNQLKVGDKVLLDAEDPRITTSEPNEEITLTVLSIFPYGTVKIYYVILTRKENCCPRLQEKKRRSVILWSYRGDSPPVPLGSLGNLGGIISDIMGPTPRNGPVPPIGPSVTRLAWHFGLLNTAAQSSSLTLICQMSPQGISSMISMRMIEKRRATYPPQYRLIQSTEGEDPEDITDDVPPRHEDPPSQPPPPSHLVHAAASYADISKRLTRFEQ